MLKFKAMIINMIILFTIPVILFHIFLFIHAGKLACIAFLCTAIVLLSLVYLLNRLNYNDLARVCLLIIICTVISYMILNFGLEPQLQIFFGLLTMLTFIQFDKTLDWIMSNFIILVSSVGSIYYVETYGPIMPDQRVENDMYLNFILGLIAYGIFTFLIFKAFKKNMDDIGLANKSLKESNERLIKQNKVIELQKNELKLFTNMASHDLKTPIRTITSFLSLIEKKVDLVETEDLQNYINLAQTGTSQLSNLIYGISEYINLENSALEKTETNLTELIDQIKIDLSDQSDLVVEYGPLPDIGINKIHLRSLFQNLIENGIKYNESNPKIIKIVGSQTKDYFEILVQDNGIGISQQYLDLIFEPFRRLHPNHVFEGTGIGLSISKRVMEMHGGKISIDSTEGVGSTFTLSFPNHLVINQPAIAADHT